MELGAVGTAAAAEMPPLDDALEALALAGSAHVDEADALEGGHAELLADGDFLLEVAKLAQDPRRSYALGELPAVRFGDPALFLVVYAEHDGVIAVLVGGLLADDDVRRELDHRDGDEPPGFVEDLGHARLLAD